ncbi:MAG: Asp-tRNA(Asn)/Glu-tRNA(Gln) amidotransferase subunit GatB [Cyclobacteriaceae bacterium]|nr:Asp-tRNA(Asn)/Glu-tRNA(Gln) amidotransferase subunit GatB [Cyclobacteriaceae bacterium]MCH8515463.1 Asp-tRNA(Asn)/Glu-tRNA(Gln) amidotransferase subunit GatB [Cyclobacteriaceae bacterium]
MDEAIRNKYTVVIGLEVHAQLLTNTKIYTSDSAEYGAMPNTHISPITLGHPGVMPKLNKRVPEFAMKIGLACNCEITRHNIFARKNYFYPDLPKGYQITQDKTPICTGGFVPIKLKDGTEKNIALTRIHIEEDAGKSMHTVDESDTLVDFNRAGVPLIEIVSEPDLRSGEEAYAYLTEVRRLVRYLEICDGNMEEGSLRCDANISVMLHDAKEYGKKVEVKNMNSIRNVQRAIEHEVERQILAIEAGEEIISETRTFDAATGLTASMRTKEDLNDYRYFPDPDLAPLNISQEWVDEVKSKLPSLPNDLFERFTKEMQLPDYDAGVLVDTKEIALYFEELCQHTKYYKAASNWMMGPIKSYLNELTLSIEKFPLKPIQIAELIRIVEDGKVSFAVASQKLFPHMLQAPEKSAEQIAQEHNLIQDSSSDSIQPIVDEVIAAFPDKVAAYQSGKKGLLGMFMGEVMKRSKGKADPKVASQLLEKSLN